ncbi:MAG: SurA N-terminal domain-containing protein [Paludibacteraceae bacterium]|nr:SurA N-terminal domain-containing protein [Paludibacteraceae bacterium]
MAILETIRRQKLLLFIVISVAMLMFILGDLNYNTLFGKSPTRVAKVEGEELEYAEYEKRVAEGTAFYEMEYGTNSLDAQTQERVRSMVWNSYLSEVVIGKQCEKLGLVVTEEELTDRMIGSNPHPILSQMRLFYNSEKGGFDLELLRGYFKIVSDYENNNQSQYSAEQVEKLSSYLSFVERMVRATILQDKYQTLVNTSFTVNDTDLKKFYDGQKTCDFSYVLKPYYQLADSMFQYTDKELMTRYQQEENSFAQAQELRNVEVLTFAIAPAASDFEDVLKEMESLKEEFAVTTEYASFVNMNSDQQYVDVAYSEADVDADLKDFAFSGSVGDLLPPTLFNRTYKMARIIENGIQEPDSVQLEHILLYESTPERTAEVADSLLKELFAGADFAVSAEKYSKAQSASQGGQLGWLKISDGLDANLLQSVKANKNNVPFIVDLGGTKQIFRVTDRTKPVSKVKLAVVSREVSHSNKTYSSIYSKASQYIAAHSDQESFEAAAVADSGYFLRAYNVTVEDYRIGDITDARALVRWAYKAKQGDVTEEVFECGDKFVVACLKSVNEKGVKPFDEVKDQVRVMVLNDKKAEYLKNEMNTSLAGGNNLSVLGEAQVSTGASAGNSYIPNIGNEPKIAGSLSKLSQDKVTLVAGNSGVYAMRLLNWNEMQTTFDPKNEISQFVARNPYGYMVYEALKNNAKIQDNRINFQ